MSNSKVSELKAKQDQQRLSKEQLLTAYIRHREIEIPELGGTVYLRSINHRARQEMRQKSQWGTEEFDEDLFTMLCLIHSMEDPKLDESDIGQLKEQDMAIYDELVAEVTLLNMMGQGKELKKESGPTQS